MKVGSLFAGIGGFDLAARWMGWHTAWFSEIEPYASAVLRKHWPGVPNHGDITQIQGGQVEAVDILCGGFPCQDISLAGKGAGIAEGTRSGLWSHYGRLIGELSPRPKWIVAENVSVLRGRGLRIVLRDLLTLGYDAEWHCIPARTVGAPHQRDRIWIVAYLQGLSKRAGLRPYIASAFGRGRSCYGSGSPLGNAGSKRQYQLLDRGCTEGREETTSPRPLHPDDAGGRTGGYPLADTDSSGLEGRHFHWGRSDQWSPWALRRTIEDQWLTESGVCRVSHGVPSRVDRLRCLGNAIVPQVAYTIFQAIQVVENRKSKK